MSRSAQKTTLDILAYIVISLGALTMLVPFLWMISVSLREPAQQFARTLIPDPVTLKNYIDLFEDLPDHAFLYLTYNSFKLSILAVLGQVLTCAMAAFVFAIVKFKGRDLLFALLLGTLMIPSQVSLIPNFIIFRYLGLIGTQWPLILPAFWGGAFGTFLLRQYFLTIPRDLVDAARMDGATLWREIVYVLTPMAVPGIASTVLLNIILAWNEAFWTLNLTTSDAAPLTVFIASYSSPEGLFWAKLSAASTLAIAPILVLGWFSQKQLVRGLTFGAVK